MWRDHWHMTGSNAGSNFIYCWKFFSRGVIKYFIVIIIANPFGELKLFDWCSLSLVSVVSRPHKKFLRRSWLVGRSKITKQKRISCKKCRGGSNNVWVWVWKVKTGSWVKYNPGVVCSFVRWWSSTLQSSWPLCIYIIKFSSRSLLNWNLGKVELHWMKNNS